MPRTSKWQQASAARKKRIMGTMGSDAIKMVTIPLAGFIRLEQQRDAALAARAELEREVERKDAENNRLRVIEAVAKDYRDVMAELIAAPGSPQRCEAARRRLFDLLDQEDD
jgi:hypothetical protein